MLLALERKGGGEASSETHRGVSLTRVSSDMVVCEDDRELDVGFLEVLSMFGRGSTNMWPTIVSRIGWAVRAPNVDPRGPTSATAAPGGARSFRGSVHSNIPIFDKHNNFNV